MGNSTFRSATLDAYRTTPFAAGNACPAGAGVEAEARAKALAKQALRVNFRLERPARPRVKDSHSAPSGTRAGLRPGA